MTRYEYVKTVLEPRFKDEDELYHHGILGMKWGVRRYQNEDGSLTPAGKKRYYKDYDNDVLNNRGLTEYFNQVQKVGAEVTNAYNNPSKSVIDAEKQYIKSSEKDSEMNRDILKKEYENMFKERMGDMYNAPLHEIVRRRSEVTTKGEYAVQNALIWSKWDRDEYMNKYA